MDTLTSHPVLKLNWREIEAVRKECNMADVKFIRGGIDNILEWYRLQPHMLKKVLDPAFIERVMLLARGSVEVAKKRIDAIATVRTALPEFYRDRDVDCDEFRCLANFVRPVPLPTLSKDLTRVFLVQMGCSMPEPSDVFSFFNFFKLIMLMNDTRMYTDYAAGDTYVIDMEHFRLADFTNFNLGLIKKVQIITAAYSIKLKGIHFINAPSFIDKVVFILKQGLKDKIADRIRVHSSLEEFYNFVPKERLPSDYGGSHGSMQELCDGWMNYLRSDAAQTYCEDADQLRTDESKRAGGRIDEDMLGIPGSFRTLSVD